ncbi:hypothetical protein CDAR_591271 [Caerostris darwini]|uniref:Uncharacterized protein n=1 Tax=Caerostris darwini TaxID=1538125 RepID=A0AAV4RKS3_9ARAC|nr:hypothetical protein CDAR_591271 [Caerostris darwini]
MLTIHIKHAPFLCTKADFIKLCAVARDPLHCPIGSMKAVLRGKCELFLVEQHLPREADILFLGRQTRCSRSCWTRIYGTQSYHELLHGKLRQKKADLGRRTDYFANPLRLARTLFHYSLGIPYEEQGLL